MDVEASVIAYIIKYNDLIGPQQHGVGQDHFHDEWRTIYKYLHRMKRDHGSVPSQDVVASRFPDLQLPRVRKTDLPMLITDIRRRLQWINFLETLNDTAQRANTPDDIVDVIQELQGRLNTLNVNHQQRSHLVDLFSAEASKRIRQEMKHRKSAGNSGLPTGLPTFDRMSGGLQRQRLVTVIARTGVGKSWLDLYFCAQAVSHGAKVILYPLEMTLFETAARLYTIFTQMHFGNDKVLRNLDLTAGRISASKVARFTAILEDKFPGQLMVADVASLSDPYTAERIEAEVEAHRPDMFWVDYITLLKSPGGRDDAQHEQISRLTKSLKNTAMRRDVVAGASAQVNRQGIQAQMKGVLLPRLEHIAFGDAIGHDSDQTFSLAKRGKDMYYALVKNRHGPEIGKTRLLVDYNNGIITEGAEAEDDDDD